jgi:hypothetical protein
LERADYKCELCGSPYKTVYDISYPKKSKNHKIENFLVVCSRCHAKLHGIHENDNNLNENEQLFSETVITSSRSYSFDIQKNSLGQKCLVIGESSKIGYHQIDILENHFYSVLEILTTALHFLTNHTEKPFSDKLSANELTYFFDIKTAVNGSQYLTITVLKRKGSRSIDRNSIMVFEDESHLFATTLNKVIKNQLM